jgi:RNA polymerase sigma-70 factor (sigma-E family)
VRALLPIVGAGEPLVRQPPSTRVARPVVGVEGFGGDCRRAGEGLCPGRPTRFTLVVSATFVPRSSSLKGDEGSVPVREAYDGLTALVHERGPALLATAVLLTGSRAAGEDLLQAALERLMRAWRRVSEDREGYLRRTMYHLAVDRWRLRRRRPEVVATVEPPTQSDGTDRYDLRDVLIWALATLPPRQRAVLVLRYWEQLSEAEAASALGCSVGTVKSSASRGLARLRSLAMEWDLSASNGARR